MHNHSSTRSRLSHVFAYGLCWGLAAGFASAATGAIAPPTGEHIQLKSITAEAIRPGTNLLANPSFESAAPNGIPQGWLWDHRNTDATCSVDRTVAHHGRQSLRFTNTTAFGAHVYGMLWLAHPIKLVEGKPYTMSAWVKSDSPGQTRLIGGNDWQIRVTARPTGGQWRRISRTFTPAAKDCDFTLRIGVEAPTPGIWIDDLKLEEGQQATLDPAEGSSAAASLDAEESDRAAPGDGPFRLAFLLANPRPLVATAEAALSSGQSLRQPLQLAAGTWRLSVSGEARAATDAPRTIALCLKDAERELARAVIPLRFFSPRNALERLSLLRKQLPSLKAELATLKSRGQDISYPRVAFTVLENFVGYVDEDIRHGEVRRAFEQLGDMEAMASRTRKELDEALAGRYRFPAVPRWTGAQRPVVKGSSFLAPARMADGTTEERPVFFTGFGHFGQVVADLEKWPNYGTNIIQIELGPNRVFPKEGVVDQAPIHAMAHILDRAQRAGVAVCLLISPHYFPDWALAKWPQLRKHREGFLQYCLHAKEGQQLLHRFITTAIAPLKDHPALHSICLSNEPVNLEEPCAPARKLWQAWLEKRHGQIGALNALCGSHYASWSEVPLPDPFGPRPAKVLGMDFIRFNQEFFSGWHKLLADAVHEVAPHVPVHAKAMNWTMLSDGGVKFGVDAYLFGRFSDINGNDAVNLYHFGEGEFAQGWLQNAMGHDLQRSVLDAPVFNTENHLIEDRNIGYVPPSHIRAALWQAAVHGQSATTIWVWERSFEAKADTYASIMHRPLCAAEVGLVNCDLNRAAFEVTALQQARPDVLLLQSTSALVWDKGHYVNCRDRLYTALSFTGLKIGFFTERQLEDGLLPHGSVLFLPNVVHLSDAALASLRKSPGRLVFVGAGELLSRDEYDRPRKVDLRGDRITFQGGCGSAGALWKQVLAKLPGWNLHPQVQLRGGDGRPVWGVEWRSANAPTGLVVNMCNYRNLPVSVTLARARQEVKTQDVLSGQRISGALTLQPLEIRLLRLEPEAGKRPRQSKPTVSGGTDSR